MLNLGYQTSDERIVDYKLWDLAGEMLRGPAPQLDKPYFTAIGAAQTFGRFVSEPFPEKLGKKLGLQALNLGISGAGPSYFLDRPFLIDLANGGEFVVLQMLSARSVSNRLIATGKNQGVSILRSDASLETTFAETAYQRILDTVSPDQLAEIRTECRMNYMSQMKELLRQIKVPTILLYLSGRLPNYDENLISLGGYWGDFPHFVNQEIIDTLAEDATSYVETVSVIGLPQPLVDRFTGAPIEIWPASRFPNVVHRTSNNYYPSPEMHADVVKRIEVSYFTQLEKAKDVRVVRRTSRRRKMLFHARVQPNLLLNFDKSLKYNFDSRWHDADSLSGQAGLNEYVHGVMSGHPVSISASFRMAEAFDIVDIDVSPVTFLMHPVIRTKSLFDYYSGGNGDRLFAPSEGTPLDGEDFGNWVSRLLESTEAYLISDFQTRACTCSDGSLQRSKQMVSLHDLRHAVDNLRTYHVGTCERFASDLINLERKLRKEFPCITLLNYSHVDSVTDTDRRIDLISSKLDNKIYRRLCAANEKDLFLYRRYCS